MSTQSEAKKAKLEKPANYYKSPDDITKDADLSPDEKRQALNHLGARCAADDDRQQ